MEPDECRFRGEVMGLVDAAMMLSPAEFQEIKVTLKDGRTFHPCWDERGDPRRGLHNDREVDLADAPKLVPRGELPNVMTMLQDGTNFRPFRFCEVAPDVRVEGGVVIF